MKKITAFVITIFLLTVSTTVFAQVKTELNKNDFMYRNGRINVVVAVLTIILCGLFFYVWRLDKKITKLEKND